MRTKPAQDRQDEVKALALQLGEWDNMFWSRFGGWKFGRKDRDDDVSRGMTDAAYIKDAKYRLNESSGTLMESHESFDRWIEDTIGAGDYPGKITSF
jgi:hypothetical protein